MNVKSEQDMMMQLLIGNLLRLGVFAAAFLVLSGGILYLIEHGGTLPRVYQFSGEPEALTHFPSIVSNAFKGQALALIQTGLLVLIFTPIVRVILSVFLFAYEKDYLYVAITLVVFGLLLVGLFGQLAV
jgi:uncharacterized membrane protein